MGLNTADCCQACGLQKRGPLGTGSLARRRALARPAPVSAPAANPLAPAAKTTEPGGLWVGELRVGSDALAGLGGHPDIRY